MEKIENELLENGLNERTLQRMTNLKHQLLKLQDASFEQGKKEERESKTNQQQHTNTSNNKTPDIQQYFNEVEILNRQVRSEEHTSELQSRENLVGRLLLEKKKKIN